MYANGRTTGVVVDAGFRCSHVAAIIDGHVLKGATQRLDVGGEDVTERLGLMLDGRSVFPEELQLTRTSLVEDFKRQRCHVPLNVYETARSWSTTGKDMFNVKQRFYRLPDKSMLDIGDEVFWAPECLFRPDLKGTKNASPDPAAELDKSLSAPGLTECVSMCMARCGDDLLRPLSRNIVMAGGGSLLPGKSITQHACVVRVTLN